MYESCSLTVYIFRTNIRRFYLETVSTHAVRRHIAQRESERERIDGCCKLRASARNNEYVSYEIKPNAKNKFRF